MTRSIGIGGGDAEERYLTYSNWLEAAKKDVREEKRFEAVFEAIRHGIESEVLNDIVMKKALAEKELEKKICIIANGICNERIEIKDPLYNELFHLTGKIFESEDEVRNYMKEKYPTCEIK